MKFEVKEVFLNDGRKVILKSHEVDEAQDVIRMVRDCSSETHFVLNYPEDVDERLTVDGEREWIQGRLDSPNGVTIGVYDDKGRCVGNCGLEPEMGYRMKTKHRCAFGIGVMKEYCNSGLGTILLTELKDCAKKMGYEQIDLGVFSDNDRAVHLYTKMGFEESGRIKNAFKLKNGTYCDEILMTCSLK